jgi:acyl-coenzyme A thioesterase PaaI-like protein
MPADAAVLSIEYKINLLAPARGESVVARARVVRAGRTITVCSGKAFAAEAGRERYVAEMLATMMTIRGREGLKG